ncbi:Peptide chain release factor 2 [Aliarcobacter thereius]|uniref:Peptide chain release factor 2 n=1 Tax=Aliarcobacter thereius TaxID=544718 RepID=A0A1C0B9E6_9BACT|nr:peptide chain release factor 2 [Aliarcobacter thereius]OCL88630.1 Peptide chain release factor 2 [Aliarcobacter thereius]OCM00227.1 Peptide chain release factor 2 [Aliarcobacter thereius]TLS72433.1 peptide chain release factor 2 [Aliarcobacter thereius]TLT07924.1 peptide chain release factor 2 [Aliarcobacter thereius]
MDAYEYSELLKLLNTKLKNIEGILKPKELKKRLDEIIELESNQDFWNDVENATKIGIEKNRILGKLNKFNKAFESLNGTNELYELATSEKDDDTFELLYEEAEDLEDLIKSTEISVMLSNPDDASNAIVTIHPGAGGTESQDWASILYRMYLRWAERNDFKIEMLDYQAGDEAGIKDVSFIIRGENAYGYLKTENGIHRLVRISPFDSNAKRHTSFTSVMVSPEIDDNIDIVIEDKDIRIDTYRASGAGGQHVNKTESAIRITHIPSGIVVQCQNDRSQHKNKDSAFKMLKSKLYELELNKQKASKDSGDKSENGWGHQIRSYVLQPYQQVKDSRSNIGYSNVEAILDGDITKMMEDVLIATNKE